MILGPRDAQSVDDEVSAARLHLELVHQDAQPDLTASQRADTKAAMRNLRTRFPNVEEVARSETPDELGGLPQHLRARQKAMRDEAGHDVNATRAEREKHRKARGRDNEPKAPKSSRAGARTPRGARAAGGRVDATLARAAAGGRRRGRRAYRQAVPSGPTSWGRLAMQSIGTAVGLSLLFLLLRSAERSGNSGAAGVAAGAFAQGIARLFSPHADVLGGGPGGKTPGLTLNDIKGLPDLTGVPIDLTGIPTLTPTPPLVKPLKPGPSGRLATYPH